jgi:hypothetical protein
MVHRGCTFLAHYQSRLALPKTSSRVIKIRATAWSGILAAAPDGHPCPLGVSSRIGWIG